MQAAAVVCIQELQAESLVGSANVSAQVASYAVGDYELQASREVFAIHHATQPTLL